MKAVEVRNLSKTFKVKVKEKGISGSLKSFFRKKYTYKEAVNNISFDVEEGEVVAFLGPNGAGKSTTIKMLTGILTKDNGDISISGLDPIKQRKKVARIIGTVFGQKEQLWTHLTPYDNFKFFGSIYDIPDKDIEEKIAEFNNIFNLEEIINVPVRNLSLGQRIKCEIIASLIHNPKILFLDEPTIGLDPIVKDQIRNLIKKMNKEYKLTIFLTSHDIGDIQSLCKRIIIINNGKIIMDNSMQEIKEKYLTSKTVEIMTTEDFDFKTIKGVEILEKDVDYVKLSVDTTKAKVINVLRLVPESLIQDISVTDMSLEKVIKSIYQG